MDKKSLQEFSKKIAEKYNLKLQPSKDILNNLLSGLLNNEKKYGFRYCPCKIPKKDIKIDADIICPCKDFREKGECICKLFVK